MEKLLLNKLKNKQAGKRACCASAASEEVCMENMKQHSYKCVYKKFPKQGLRVCTICSCC